MIKSIDFYFDFISPYSYLAYKKLNMLNINGFASISYFEKKYNLLNKNEYWSNKNFSKGNTKFIF